MMSLDFYPQQRIVVDSIAGIKIYPPRVLPAPSPSDSERVEFEYSIYRGDVSYSFNVFGHEQVQERGGRRERAYTLSIDLDWMLEDALRLKSQWSLPGDEFSFLCEFARGLVGVLALRLNIDEDARYSAMICTAVLGRHNISVPEKSISNHSGWVVLAEIFVPARIDEGGAL